MKDLRILDEGSLRWIVDLATFTPKAVPQFFVDAVEKLQGAPVAR